ncbi:MAG TPA: DinB family protein [Flavobacteriia bacterium]|nr:DinB family protein [Flavobacteriia bacterium]
MKTTLIHHPFYQTYIDKVNLNNTILENLQNSLNEVFSVLGDVSEEQANYSYKKDKWSLKQLLQHIIDTERVMSYRAFAIARNDKNNLHGFDENEYIYNSNASNSNFINLLKEFSLLRKSNIAMFKNFTPKLLSKIGKANNSEINTYTLGYILSGHVYHHLDIVKKRYLN